MIKFKKAWHELKKGVPRELGLFLFLLGFAGCAAAVFLPFFWLLDKLPDWAWGTFGIGFLVWIVFSDTIEKAWTALRGEDE